MNFELTILGVNAAVPAFGRNPSAQVLNIQDRLYLIDCGEGTQSQLTRFGVRRSRINQIFISHLHGDHIYGLPGLLTTFALFGRTNALDIFGPADLEHYIMYALKYSSTVLPYRLHFHTVDPTRHTLVYENMHITVHSIPLKHRVPASGYLFQEKPRPRRIIPSKIEEYNIPYSKIKAIKREGLDFTTLDGQCIPNIELTTPAPASRGFAYCSDTAYAPDIVPIIQGVDLLYHEATFLHRHQEQADRTTHSTTYQAAHIAKEAQVKQLIIGHYSARYQEVDLLLQETKHVFPNAFLGIEGKTYTVPS